MDKGSIEEINFKNFKWINIQNTTPQILEKLSQNYHFHHLALEDCLSTIQQPKVDEYDNYLFMVFHLPRYIKKTYRTVALELDVFLGQDYIITLSNGELKPLVNLFSDLKEKRQILKDESPAFLLYEILSQSFNYCFPMLEKIAQKLDLAEDELYEDQTRKTLEKISILAQDIINFRRVIGPQRFFIRDLETMKTKIIGAGLEIYYDDIEDKIDRIWDMLNNFKEVCDVLQRTNESILTQRLNEIMKLLTIFSAIMLPLTVITGFYGMNIVGLPIANHSAAPEIITALLSLVIVVMLVLFWKRKWL